MAEGCRIYYSGIVTSLTSQLRHQNFGKDKCIYVSRKQLLRHCSYDIDIFGEDMLYIPKETEYI